MMRHGYAREQYIYRTEYTAYAYRYGSWPRYDTVMIPSTAVVERLKLQYRVPRGLFW